MGLTPFLYQPMSNWVDPATTQTRWALQTDPARPILPFPLYLCFACYLTHPTYCLHPPAVIYFLFRVFFVVSLALHFFYYSHAFSSI